MEPRESFRIPNATRGVFLKGNQTGVEPGVENIPFHPVVGKTVWVLRQVEEFMGS